MFKVRPAYTFDDVLLVPKHSTVQHRRDVDLSVKLPKNIKLAVPIVSANMKNVTGPVMASAISCHGGLGILHRFVNSTSEYVNQYKEAINNINLYCSVYDRNVGVSIGINGAETEALSAVIDLGCKIVCVDVAHGDHVNCINTCNYISKTYPNVLLIAVKDVLAAQEQDITALAKKAQISRQNIYRMLSDKGNPEFNSLITLLDALGFQLDLKIKQPLRKRVMPKARIARRRKKLALRK